MKLGNLALALLPLRCRGFFDVDWHCGNEKKAPPKQAC